MPEQNTAATPAPEETIPAPSGEWVEIEHDDIAQTTTVHPNAVKHWTHPDRGWRVVGKDGPKSKPVLAARKAAENKGS